MGSEDDKRRGSQPAGFEDMRATRFVAADQELVVISYALPSSRIDDERLTAAERDVAYLALEGLSNAEIASRRGSSPRTVANQLASIFAKLGLSSRHELSGALRVPREEES